MNDRVMQFRVGVVVMATGIIAALLVTLNSPSPKGLALWGRGTYQVTIELEQAPGIGPNTPVRKNGLLIGRVSSVDDLDDRVAVRATIDAGRKLYPQYKCQVRTSVLGDATLEFVACPIPPGTPPLTDGAVVRGEVVGNPLDMLANIQGDLKITIKSLGRAGDEVSNLADRVNTAFGDKTEQGRASRLLDKMELALDNFSRSAHTLDDFFLDPELKGSVHDARVTMSEVRAATQDVRTAAISAEKNLKNLEGFTEPLGRNGEQVAKAFIDSLEGLGKVVEELTVLTQALNNREGTVGQLIHNPELYNNFNRLIANSNNVVLQICELAARLRPTVEDARVFMDKIAREPGRLIGGALNQGPGIK
jgi:phospholipid/cholesterol/gamma-HCH transport system substrate-binding protein